MSPLRLGLRGRLVVATSLVSLATLGAAFAAVSFAVNRAQEQQLDEALLPAARDEAQELSLADSPGGEPPVISDRPGPAANDVGPLPKYVAVYRPNGSLASATANFGGAAPSFAALGGHAGDCFDLQLARLALRGVLVPIPQHPDAALLMAVPRADLDGDASFLARAMLTVFTMAVAWTATIAWWIAGRLTHAHRAIVETTKRVEAGDLTARVGSSGAADPEGLGRNIDEMIERLALLLRGQQQFIAQAAHELRSPLTTLYGELSFALRRERAAEEYREIIEEALAASRRLKTLAEDLLSLARLGTEAMPIDEDVSLLHVVSAAAMSVEAEARRHAVRVETSGCDGALVGRAVDLERMLRNLLENAIHHAPPGSMITIETRQQRDDWLIEVRDEGAGVEPELRARIFEPFFRGSAERAGAYAGAGLGLTIARDIARLHGGDLDLANLGDGPGACFVVRLPAKHARASVNE